jgi:hypothetical protein
LNTLHEFLPPLLTSRTKKKFPIGGWKTHLRYLTLWMIISKFKTDCRSCGHTIQKNDLCGQYAQGGIHCHRCIVIPKWARRFEFEFKIRRTSKIWHVTMIGSNTSARHYMKMLKQNCILTGLREKPLLLTGDYDSPDPIASAESDRLQAAISKQYDRIREVRF